MASNADYCSSNEKYKEQEKDVAEVHELQGQRDYYCIWAGEQETKQENKALFQHLSPIVFGLISALITFQNLVPKKGTRRVGAWCIAQKKAEVLIIESGYRKPCPDRDVRVKRF